MLSRTGAAVPSDPPRLSHTTLVDNTLIHRDLPVQESPPTVMQFKNTVLHWVAREDVRYA
jgi:hypothetical protein